MLRYVYADATISTLCLRCFYALSTQILLCYDYLALYYLYEKPETKYASTSALLQPCPKGAHAFLLGQLFTGQINMSFSHAFLRVWVLHSSKGYIIKSHSNPTQYLQYLKARGISSSTYCADRFTSFWNFEVRNLSSERGFMYLFYSRCFWCANMVAVLSLACVLTQRLHGRFTEMPTQVITNSVPF